jgi:uncharacterized protein
MIVVSNTTPLIGLAAIQRFDLLRDLFGDIHIAPAVYKEAFVAERGQGGTKYDVSEASWLKTTPVQDRLAVNVLLDELDAGEAETIVLAHELKADWVLMDERKGRRKLTQLGLNKIGTASILLRAKQAGLVSNLRQELEQLRQHGFSISQSVIDAVVQQANEA